VLAVLALVPRLRREFKRPGVYLLIGMFVLCAIPPIVWNAQHAWITLAHLRSRGNLDRGFGFHPAEVLSFLGQHFIVYSPLLFLALVWGVIASWRRINQQFKVLFLMWFGLPVFVFYCFCRLTRAPRRIGMALPFFGFGLVATYFWWERLQTSVLLRICASVAVLVGLIMSLVALDTDLLRVAGYQLPRSDPSDRMRGWKSATQALEKMRNDLEAQSGEKLFLIADARDRASEISFYLQRQTSRRPGHPPAYIPESQDMVNQFSFWPRYDQFVELKPGMQRPDGEVYTKRTASIYSSDAMRFLSGLEKRNVCLATYEAAFQSTEPVGTIEVSRYGKVIRIWQVFLCRSYRTLPL
jgi:hypothetical protein